MSDETPEQQLADLAVEVMFRLLDEGAAEQACLQWLVERCVERFHVCGAGVLLADDTGRLDVAAASDQCFHALQRLATTSGEGPGPACYERGSMVVVRDVRLTRSRWPCYAEMAWKVGISSTCSLPLQQRQTRELVGALNLFSTLPGPPTVELHSVQLIADAAAGALLGRRAVQAARRQVVQLQTAWSSQVVVEQAKGALSERWRTNVDTAFESLRRHSRDYCLPIDEVARSVVEGPPDTDPFPNFLARSRWPPHSSGTDGKRPKPQE